MAGAGVVVDASDTLEPTNIVFWMRNVTAVCEAQVDLDCMLLRRLEPLICYLETEQKVVNQGTSKLDDYLPELQQQQLDGSSKPQAVDGGLLAPAAARGGVDGATAGGGGSGGGGAHHRVVVVACTVAAGSIVVVLLLAGAIFATVRAKQKRKAALYHSTSGPATPRRDLSYKFIWTNVASALDTGPGNSTDVNRSADIDGCSRALPPTSHQGAIEVGSSGMLSTTAMAADHTPVTLETQPRSTIELHVRLLKKGEGGADGRSAAASAADDEGVQRRPRSGQQWQQQQHHHGEVGAVSGPGCWHTYVSVQEEGGDQQGVANSKDQGGTPYTPAAPAPVIEASSSSSGGNGGTAAAGQGTEGGGAADGGGGVVELLPVTRGKGAFGRVVEGLYGGQRVAVKLLACEGPWGAPAEKLAESFEQEVQVLSRCCHPNVVRLLAACVAAPRLCLVLELMETSLAQLIHHKHISAAADMAGGAGGAGRREPTCRSDKLLGGLMPLPKVLHISASIANALAYLHPTIVHRDLKPAYMAPECFDLVNRCVSHKADIYSLGVSMWEMLAGEQPWAGLNPLAIALTVTYKQSQLPLSGLVDCARCPPKLARLINSCWERDPDRRPAAAEVAKVLALMMQAPPQSTQQVLL